jgi:hypothetical protein
MRIVFVFIIFLLLISCKSILQDSVPGHEEHGEYYPHPIYPDVILDSTAIKLKEPYYIPLSDPIWYAADKADYMQGADYVIGISIHHRAYAFPWWVMKNYHIANLYLDSIPIVVTLCEMCSGGGAFHAVIENQRLVFMQEGVYHGTWFMRDTSTDSYWTPFEGECFAGKEKGRSLDPIPTYQTTWSEWLKQYPGTKVIYDLADMRSGHGSFEFPGSQRIAKGFELSLKIPVSKISNPFDLVLGVMANGFGKCYAFNSLDSLKTSVLNDVIHDSIPVVIFHQLNTTYGGAYNPVIKVNQRLHFIERNHDIFDEETGSRWNLKGECIEGMLKDIALTPYRFTMKEKYGWVNSDPDTEYFCFCK